MRDIVFEILKELRLIRKQLEVLTGKKFSVGNRFDF